MSPVREQDKEDAPQLWLQKVDAPCKVGFPMGEERGCPLFEDDVDDAALAEVLAVVARVADFRSAEVAQAG